MRSLAAFRKISGLTKGLLRFFPEAGSRDKEPSADDGESSLELKEKGWRPVFSIAPGLNEKRRIEMKEHLERNNLELYTGPGRDLLAASRCSVAASGTVAVEAMMLDCYMVALYRVSPLSAFVVRHLVRTKYYTIPNTPWRRTIPELMQEEATPENIVRETMKWLEAAKILKPGSAGSWELAREMLGRPGSVNHGRSGSWGPHKMLSLKDKSMVIIRPPAGLLQTL